MTSSPKLTRRRWLKTSAAALAMAQTPMANMLFAQLGPGEEAIPFLDLLPAFVEAGQRTRLYKPRDTHWNLAGNRLAAEVIAPIMRERIQEGR